MSYGPFLKVSPCISLRVLGSPALLLYETCISFDRECRHIWQRKPSAATWIFTCNRYFVIALYIVNVPSTCPTLVRLSQVLDILPYIVWAFFSSLRTFAMCNRAWHISLLIFMLSLTPVWIYIVRNGSCSMLIEGATDRSAQYRDVHQYTANFPPPTYCDPDTPLAHTVTVVARVCLIVSDILVLSVTWSKTYGIVRLAREHGLNKSLSVTKVLLRDGRFSLRSVFRHESH
ncbi:hypothetical protein BD414DRAFT_414409 [Trametes punicea]|nr:hypothetical protein BD414DRAFT_414409 [Trametes punicea]